jgi:hypothetical protein
METGMRLTVHYAKDHCAQHLETVGEPVHIFCRSVEEAEAKALEGLPKVQVKGAAGYQIRDIHDRVVAIGPTWTGRATSPVW